MASIKVVYIIGFEIEGLKPVDGYRRQSNEFSYIYTTEIYGLFQKFKTLDENLMGLLLGIFLQLNYYFFIFKIGTPK